uniref:Ribosomal protein n=1 Tax=Anolis carolinensis TaxID=28377 RepID=G1K8R7_ANOCA
MAALLLRNAMTSAVKSVRFLNGHPSSCFFSSWLLGRSKLVSPLLCAIKPQSMDLTPVFTGCPALNFQPVAGMKTKGVLKRRCKDCFFVRRRGRMYVYCKTHPRHKQRKL